MHGDFAGKEFLYSVLETSKVRKVTASKYYYQSFIKFCKIAHKCGIPRQRANLSALLEIPAARGNRDGPYLP